jgi:hypothetical protein
MIKLPHKEKPITQGRFDELFPLGILQNIWRKVWDEFRAHRRDLKERGEAAETKWYSEKLKRLAAGLTMEMPAVLLANE